MKLALLATLAFASPVLAQGPEIGIIDFYGVRTVPMTTLQAALGVRIGDSVTTAVFERIKALEAVPQVQRAMIDAVCCEEGKTTLYVGIEETGTSAMVFDSAPTGSVELPSEVLQAYEAFEAAFAEAVKAGEFGEDDSQGYALMRFPAARAAQERFAQVASHHRGALAAVLHRSANQEHRAIAAQVLAYARANQALVDDLVHATRDPYSTVRNNVVRALAILASFGREHPDRGIAVPPEPLVDLLNSLVWTDRNKSSMALMRISESRDPALLAVLKARALPSLIEMARWKAPGHALAPFFILGRIAGVPEAEIFPAWESGRREEVIQKASR
jgi:hypothetical protein